MYYTIYKVTNLINGKYYIGKHQTKHLDDGYMGSGKLVMSAIKKYGVENFKKDILEIYEVEWKMNVAERILVVIDSEFSYNLCSGGKGRFGYINNSGIGGFKNKKHSLETKNKISQKRKGKKHSLKTLEILSQKSSGRKTSDETKHKMSESHKGKTVSEETRLKISESHKGKTKRSCPSRKKRILTEEHKRKLSESRKKYLASIVY